MFFVFLSFFFFYSLRLFRLWCVGVCVKRSMCSLCAWDRSDHIFLFFGEIGSEQNKFHFFCGESSEGSMRRAPSCSRQYRCRGNPGHARRPGSTKNILCQSLLFFFHPVLHQPCGGTHRDPCPNPRPTWACPCRCGGLHDRHGRRVLLGHHHDRRRRQPCRKMITFPAGKKKEGDILSSSTGRLALVSTAATAALVSPAPALLLRDATALCVSLFRPC